ncbi:DeoR/GlpR family DNA-binding transcription regulator (plasmid) [Alicyclobacillus fastidiosus]|uniref:DeoR/GlpR family DNA-binding transcription regulator n=1 Tax=Alicyclobacillus fastidiosus TaxID=392011 RepID=A0ABY6ZQX3_9BACL|nr:DeoR/GlpR family DNA-binding transcription regulator [Alicyclobacillus fastidiosus]WAH44842.1 DeoR/GlpR family DNA-binding transcription regulator [Alicyclobacillus fastidiosus]GMA65810.1 DeoR family transcriptional regulator [Alicyclobacillus fastidiosus]GMA65882.1 DeoR family transcriptional regulator [Alicyclobacillus fastidiosus]
MRKLYTEERRNTILHQIVEESRASVAQLAKMLNVSEVTIRSDLKELERQGQIRRTHGGAIIREDNDVSFSNRLTQRREEKARIAACAAEYIHEHDSIMLDASSTCLELAKQIRKLDRAVTVVTNGLYAAQELSGQNHINVFIIGGMIRNQNTVEGLVGTSIFDFIHPTKFFFSARALASNGSLMDFDLQEVELKRHMFRRAAQRICVLDASKFGTYSVSEFGNLSDVQTLVTDEGVSDEVRKDFPETDFVIAP